MDEMLVERDGIFYTRDTNKPYSGPVFSLHKNGNLDEEGTLKGGRLDGLYKSYFRNGEKEYEINYKNHIKHGVWRSYRSSGDYGGLTPGLVTEKIFDYESLVRRKDYSEYYINGEFELRLSEEKIRNSDNSWVYKRFDYHHNGELSLEYTEERSKQAWTLISEKHYDENGQLIYEEKEE